MWQCKNNESLGIKRCSFKQKFANFAAIYFTYNFRACKGLMSNILLNPMNEVIRNIFDRMLPENSENHGSVLNNDIQTFKEFLRIETDINTLDKGGLAFGSLLQ